MSDEPDLPDEFDWDPSLFEEPSGDASDGNEEEPLWTSPQWSLLDMLVVLTLCAIVCSIFAIPGMSVHPAAVAGLLLLFFLGLLFRGCRDLVRCGEEPPQAETQSDTDDEERTESDSRE